MRDMPRPTHASRLRRALRRHAGRAVAATATITAAALILTGCATSSSESSSAGGGTLRVGIVSLSDADALDPANASTTGGYVIARQLYDTLTEYGTDGSWQPELAASVTADDDSAKVWTVTLNDATWSDGSAVTASDVVYTVKRWFSEKLPPSGSLAFIDPDKVVAKDDHTVQFTLKYGTVTFPEALTSPTTSIVPTDFDATNPIGSGPYTLKTNNPGVQLTFDANPNYFRGAPGTSELDVVSFADSSSAVSALTAGQIDVDASMDPTLVDLVTGTSGYSIYNYHTSGTLTWVMNTSQKPLNDPIVRQALMLSVDRQALIDQVYNGYATLGNDVFNPFDPMYNSSLTQKTYSPATAKAMLEAAGYTLPVTIKLTGTDNQPTSVKQNEALVKQAAEAGFNIEYTYVDSATFYGDSYGTYPLSLSYWGYLGIFDQAAFTIVNDAPYNSSHWQNDQYDKLYKEAITTVDETKRKALVAQMQEIEYQTGAYIVPLFIDAVVGLSNSVTGAASYPNSDGAFGYNFRILSLS